jgi:exodeoxyribonuclease V beta subunit
MPEGARLATVPPQARLAEMEFHLALAPLRVDALLALLQAHDLVAERRTFGLRQRIEGLLTGRIDLVYEHGGRYYVLDYKSNQLPAYDEAALARAVRESEYDLQYVLYTLALHRWLRFRLGADYDIQRHLGGVRYLFSRGLSRDDASRPGVHALTLDPALVEALDALCRGESP